MSFRSNRQIVDLPARHRLTSNQAKYLLVVRVVFQVTEASNFISTFRPTMPGYELSSADRLVIDKKNLCPKCEGLLREAVQTIACGHRYCKTCVETILW